MARLSITDHLQSHQFQLYDVGSITPTALPVFTPGSSFSSVSMPELQIEMQDVVEGNSLFTKRVIKHAEISALTLSRGATAADSDFYRWFITALYGRPGFFSKSRVQIGGVSPRRDLLLVHFFRHSPLPAVATQAVTGGLILGATGAGAVLDGIQGVPAAAVGASIAGGVVAAAGAFAPVVLTNLAVRLPARAWVLKGCIPTRYKPGSDFDAMSADVSIMELELAVEGLTEVSLSAPPLP